MKKLLFISLAVVLALSMALVGCGGGTPTVTEYDLTIADADGGSTNPAAGTHTYEEDDVVNLVATPDEFYTFAGWTGDVATVADANSASTTITMDDDYSITPTFELEPWTDTVELSFHCTANAFASVWKAIYDPWIQQVEALVGEDGGTFEIADATFGSTPFSSEDSLTGLGAGLADLGQMSGDTFELSGIANVPFLFDAVGEAYALHKLFVDEVDTWDVKGELDDVKILLATPLWPNQWFGTTEVKELADFQGLVIRAEAADVPVIQALGAEASEIPTGEIAQALQLGTVDGCFFTYSASTFAGIADASDYCTEVNLFPRAYYLAMNRGKYESLHPEARALLDGICTAADSASWAEAHLATQGYHKGLCIDLLSAPIYVLPDSERDLWVAATTDVGPDWVDEVTALGYAGQAFYDRAVQLAAEAP